MKTISITTILATIGTFLGIMSLYLHFLSFKKDQDILMFEANYFYQQGYPEMYDISLVIRNIGRRPCDIVTAALFWPPDNFNFKTDVVPSTNSSPSFYYFTDKDYPIKIKENEQVNFYRELTTNERKMLEGFNRRGLIIVEDAKGRAHKIDLFPSNTIKWIL